jgi:hypothetical protein
MSRSNKKKGERIYLSIYLWLLSWWFVAGQIFGNILQTLAFAFWVLSWWFVSRRSFAGLSYLSCDWSGY